MKLLITGAIFVFLFSIVDARVVFAHVATIPVWVFLCVIFSYFLALFFGTIRWAVLLSAHDIKVPLSRLFAYNFSWLFYSIALPGGKIAAEAIRIYQILADTKDTTVSREKIVIASLMDRVIAVLALGFVAVPFFIIVRDTVVAGASPVVSTLAVLGLIALVLVACVPLEFFVRPFARFLPPSVASIVSSLGGVLSVYRTRPFLFLSTLFLSFLMNLALGVGLFAITVSLGIPISFFTLFFVFCISMLTAFIPLTVGGVGVREGTLVYLLATISGTTFELSLSASLIMLGASLIVAAIGGVIELCRHFVRISP